jgi:hypothetical protein
MLYITFNKAIELDMHIECFKKLMNLKDSLMQQMGDEQMINLLAKVKRTLVLDKVNQTYTESSHPS